MDKPKQNKNSSDVDYRPVKPFAGKIPVEEEPGPFLPPVLLENTRSVHFVTNRVLLDTIGKEWIAIRIAPMVLPMRVSFVDWKNTVVGVDIRGNLGIDPLVAVDNFIVANMIMARATAKRTGQLCTQNANLVITPLVAASVAPTDQIAPIWDSEAKWI